jgi:F0F1-type ATP synthase membrane subunit b/b'
VKGMGDITIFGLPISLGTMVYQAIIFTVLVFMLKKLVFKKLVDILENRKQHIEKQLKLTEEYHNDAKKNLDSSEDILKQAKVEAREIIRHSQKEAYLLIQEAKEEAKIILTDAKEDAFRLRSRSYSQNKQVKGA